MLLLLHTALNSEVACKLFPRKMMMHTMEVVRHLQRPTPVGLLLELDLTIVRLIIAIMIHVEGLNKPPALAPTERLLQSIPTRFTILGATSPLDTHKVLTVDHVVTLQLTTRESVPWRWVVEDTLLITILLLGQIHTTTLVTLMRDDMLPVVTHETHTRRRPLLDAIHHEILTTVEMSDTSKIFTIEDEDIPQCCRRIMAQHSPAVHHTIDQDTRLIETLTIQEYRTMLRDAPKTIFDTVPHTHLLNVISLTHAVHHQVLLELTHPVCRMKALQIDCDSMVYVKHLALLLDTMAWSLMSLASQLVAPLLVRQIRPLLDLD